MKYPAGITDQDVEFFDTKNGLMAFVGGEMVAWQYLPQQVLDLVREDLSRHPEALRHLAHLTDDEGLQIYARCRFGAMGMGEPDITACGKTNGEHWCDCTDCPLRSVFRNTLQVANGTLSRREIQVARLIAQGKFGKEISAELLISESTLNTHKHNIFTKTGVSSNVELTIWAHRINLI